MQSTDKEALPEQPSTPAPRPQVQQTEDWFKRLGDFDVFHPARHDFNLD